MSGPMLRGLSILLTVAAPAERQLVGSGPPSMHLFVSKTLKIAPDALVADMLAIAAGPRALQAQQQVNALVTTAKVIIDRAKLIQTAFQGHSVTFVEERPARWVAQQAIEAKGNYVLDVIAIAGRVAIALFLTTPEEHDAAGTVSADILLHVPEQVRSLTL
jgi:hypothetical protein